ncbi:class I SAM-dependent methyltransferase [Nocardioides pelophilus]|uniref:class I SAM-dependent methyltransferase n=1 Tax=Nocardioides pelophilus TaxID=2172019 RepID=UPI0016017617|nr:class I SAM-dependent methyltransferase [Nocardioides pelophilus]
MTDHTFDQSYWEKHWSSGDAPARSEQMPANPYLSTETAALEVGSALDAGCGTGAEALWLAAQGWTVTGADISSAALETAAARADAAGLADHLEWVHADLTSWEPERSWDLVVTSYAHPAAGQLDFYRRIASWVAPGGTLLIVAHDHGAHPEHATAAVAEIKELFAGASWRIDTGYESSRTVEAGGGVTDLRDVVVRVHRTS